MSRSTQDAFAWIDQKINIVPTASNGGKSRKSLNDLVHRNDEKRVDDEGTQKAAAIDLNYLFEETEKETGSCKEVDKKAKVDVPMDLNYLFDKNDAGGIKDDHAKHIADKLKTQITKFTEKFVFLRLRSMQYQDENHDNNRSNKPRIGFIQPPTHRPPPPPTSD